jgi:hypothetical protein
MGVPQLRSAEWELVILFAATSDVVQEIEMVDATDRIADLLVRFISGKDRSRRLAGELEVAIDREFPEDEDWQDVVHALACYRPAGGEYLYDEHGILPKCRWALSALSHNRAVPLRDDV